MIEIKRSWKILFCHLDKYTTTRSRRYMNLYLHYDSDPVNLGMVTIKGSMPTKNVEKLVKERLHEFGLKEEDIVAATTN